MPAIHSHVPPCTARVSVPDVKSYPQGVCACRPSYPQGVLPRRVRPPPTQTPPAPCKAGRQGREIFEIPTGYEPHPPSKSPITQPPLRVARASAWRGRPTPRAIRPAKNRIKGAPNFTRTELGVGGRDQPPEVNYRAGLSAMGKSSRRYTSKVHPLRNP
jgi:hypothetical protein